MSFFKKIFAPMQAYEIEDFVRDGFLPGVKGKVKTMGIDVFAQREGLLALTLESKHHKLLNYLKEQNFQYPASVNNTSIISYAISVGMRAKQVRTLLESGASFEYERGLTPLEAALDVDAEYDMYVLLLEYKIAARSLTRAPMIYQIASASHLKEDFRAELVDALAKKGLIDVNEKDDQAEPITQYLHDAELPLLLKEVIRAGGDLRPIATTYNFEYQSDFGHELSQAIFTKQTRMKDEEKLPFLEKDDFEACLENIAQAGDANGKQLILSLTRNCIIPDMDKVILGEKIMQLGVDVDEVSQDEDASTAFVDYCRYYEFHEYFGFHDFLLDHGADINGKGKSPLVHLLRSGQFNLLKHLIQRGLDIVSLDSEGLGAMNAFRFPDLMGPIARRIEILDFLVANGLDINQQVIAFADEAYPSTGLIELLIYAEDVELLEYVLAHYPQCEIKGVEISSALRRPVFSDDLCLRLIAKKPDYTQSHFYSNTIDDTKYTYSAESIGIAIDLDRFAVAEQLLDQYPQMKAHCEVEPLYYRVYLNTRSGPLAEKLIRRDPDLNRIYHRVMGDPNREELKMNITQPGLIYLLSNVDDDQRQRDVLLHLVDVMLECGADAGIPRVKLEQSESFMDEEGSILVATGSHRDTRFLDLLIDKGGVDPNKRISQCLESQIFSLLGNRYLSDADVCFYYRYFAGKTGIDWQVQDKFNSTLLIEAASNCRPQTTQYLIELGADIHVKGGFDNAWPMHKAISNYGWLDNDERAQTVAVLLAAGADKEAFDSEDFSPLMSACHYGCTQTVQVILDAGVNVNATNSSGVSAINLVSTKKFSYDDPDDKDGNNAAILWLLSQHGADVNHVPDEGATPLSDAIGFGYRTVFQRLLQLQADVNLADKLGTTALMVAVQYGDIYFCNELLSTGQCDMQARDAAGENLLHKAVKRSDSEEAASLLEYLLSNGVTDGAYKETMPAFLLASAYCRDALLPLFNACPNVLSARDADGFDACLWALYSNIKVAETARIKTLETLLGMGLSLQSQDNNGRNLLQWAILLGRMQVAQFLLNQGADANHCDQYGYDAACYLVHSYLGSQEHAMDEDDDAAMSDEEYYNGPLSQFTQELNLLVASGAALEKAIEMAQERDERQSLVQCLFAVA